MRLGVVSTSYPRWPNDHSGHFVSELNCELLEQVEDLEQIETLVPEPALASNSERQRIYPLHYSADPLLFATSGAPEVLGDLTQPRRALQAWSQVPRFIFALATKMHERCPAWDALISHWLLPCGIVAASTSPQLPHVAIAHSSDVRWLGRFPGGHYFLDRLARSGARLVLTSASLRTALQGSCRTARTREWAEQASIIPMGISCPPAHPSREELRRALRLVERPLVVFVGRLVPVKGVDVLLEAGSQLPRGTQIVIVGDGPERKRLEKLARSLNLAARFVGTIPPAEVWQWLFAADLFVLPSRILASGRQDSLPVSLLQAMRAGLPCVATRVGGIAEIIRDGHNGLLVGPDDPNDLSRSIRTLLADADLRARVGHEAISTAREFEWPKIAQRIWHELERAIHSEGSVGR